MKRKPVAITPKTYTHEKRVYENGKGSGGVQPGVDWFAKPEAELYEHTFARVRQIKQNQVTRRYELYAYQQAYTSRFGPAASGSLFSPTNRNPSQGQYAISANIIKSCVDTACARIAKEKPRAFVLPNRGKRKLRMKARKLQLFLDGAFQGAKVYAESEDVFRGGGIFGDGNLLIYGEDGKLKSTSLKIDEIHFDQVDGMYDRPREAHWSHPVPRRELLARYPKCAKEIEQARSAWRGEMTFMGQADMVEVIRSWRVRSTADADDGTYAVSICTATLEKKPYQKDRLPIIRWHWTEPTYGAFGDGIAKELFGLQRAISDILRGVLKSIRMFAVPRVWVNKLANVTQQMISNEISVNTYAGDKPVFDTPQAASPDVYQFIQWLIDYAYKQVGLSQLSAQSEKPAGLNSGVAMRNYQDIETQRFAIIGQRWERFYMECAEVLIDVAKDLYEDTGTLSVNVPGRGTVQTIDWKDVSLARDQYELQVWPTNLLPQTPEGKFQTVQEWIASGFMPREVALSQMRMPIVDDWISRETAALENVEMCVSKILDDGKYIAPDPIGNMKLAVDIAQAEYLNALDEEDVSAERIDMLTRWISRAIELRDQATAQNAPPPPAGPGGPVGQAAPPPPAPLAPQGSGAVPMPAAA